MLMLSFIFFFFASHSELSTLSQHVAKIMESQNHDYLPPEYTFLPWIKICFYSLNSALQRLLIVESGITVMCRDQS